MMGEFISSVGPVVEVADAKAAKFEVLATMPSPGLTLLEIAWLRDRLTATICNILLLDMWATMSRDGTNGGV